MCKNSESYWFMYLVYLHSAFVPNGDPKGQTIQEKLDKQGDGGQALDC